MILPKPKKLLLFFTIFYLLSFIFYLSSARFARAADYIFGTDPNTGDFVIREKGGSIKLRIDASGNLDVPMRGLTSGGENLVPNGGFEGDVDNDGIPNSWTTNFQTSCSGCTYSLDSSDTSVRDGTKSLALTTSSVYTNNDVVTIASDIFPVTPGKSYTSAIDAKGNGGGFSLKILFYTSSSSTTYASTNTSNIVNIKDNITTTSSWTNYSGDFTVPSSCGATNNLGCTRARLLIVHNPGVSISARNFDNAKVTLTPISLPLNASNVSAGEFGANTGLGVYTFPGNVGIGTSLPAAKLDIAGITSTIANNSGDINILPSVNLIIPQGNVGIGTTNPAYKLDVTGSINAAGFYLNGSPFIQSQWTASGSNIYYNSGNIGIGTTAPVHRIDLNGAIKLGDEGIKPVCSLTHRGTLWMSYGGVGIKDSVEICAKDASDIYSWRIIY